MAEQGTVRAALRMIHAGLQSLAAERGWGDNYRAYVHFDMNFGQTYLMVVAPGYGGGTERDQRAAVYEHFEKLMSRDRLVWQGFHLIIRTFDQVAEGGFYEVREPYQPLEDLLTPSVLRP